MFFPLWYPHRGNPMAGLFVKHHAEAVLPHADVSILQVVGEHRRDGQLLESTFEIEHGLPTVRVYYRKTPGRLGKIIDAFLYFQGTYKGYSRLISETRKADIHHVHTLTRAGMFPWLLRMAGGVPYIITEHWSRYHPNNRAKSYSGIMRRWLTRQVIKGSSAVCPVNQKLADAMKDVGLKHPHYEIINNVVDMDRFPLGNQEVSNNRFLHVSCFDEAAKHVKGLLDALMLAVKKNPAIYLTLVGDGPDWQEVKDYSKSIGADLYTEFVGLKQGDELVSYFRENAHFVLFSNYENQPVVVLEALATGMHVISSKVGSVPEMLADGRGDLVEVGNSQQLADCMVKSTQSPFSWRKESREYVAKNYSFESVGLQHKRLYDFALGHESE